MRRRLDKGTFGVRLSFAVIIVSAVVASIGIGALGATIFLRAASESELREALIENCERNGNPLREVLIEEQKAAIESPHDPRIHKLFPDAPTALAEQVIREGNDQHRDRIKLLAPVDCAAQYERP